MVVAAHGAAPVPSCGVTSVPSTAWRVWALVLLGMGCRREAPPADVPRVYETADCAAVMRLPGMTPDEVARGVFSVGLLAVQERREKAAAWDRDHYGRWVRWRVVGWLDPWGLVTGTSLFVESVEIESAPGAVRNR